METVEIPQFQFLDKVVRGFRVLQYIDKVVVVPVVMQRQVPLQGVAYEGRTYFLRDAGLWTIFQRAFSIWQPLVSRRSSSYLADTGSARQSTAAFRRISQFLRGLSPRCSHMEIRTLFQRALRMAVLIFAAFWGLLRTLSSWTLNLAQQVLSVC